MKKTIRKRISVVEEIINYIVESIIEGEYKPGDKLPSEEQMSENLEVSRASLREATKILEYQGVLEIRRSQGTFISQGFKKSMIDPMIYSIILNNSTSDFQNLMELRQMTEVGITRLAIINSSTEDIEKLKEKIVVMKKIVEKDKYNYEDLFKADNEFHDTLGVMSKNPMADQINKFVRNLTHSTRFQTVKDLCIAGNALDLIRVHTKLLNLIEEKKYKDLDDIVWGTYFIE